MSRRSRRNRGRATVVKASAPSHALQGTVAVPVADLLAVMARAGASGATAVAEPLPRPTDWSTMPFGPGLPLVPQPINAPDPVTGRAAPRRFDYPVSVNLPGVDTRLLPWKVLRDAADQIDLMRRAIEVRKAEVRGLGWDITISSRAVEHVRAADKTRSDADVMHELRDDLSDEIDRLRTWWEMPDRTNGFDFSSWLGQIMEEHLVLDAIAIYPRMTLGGDLFSLEVIDGTTIKPLLDDRGNLPAPPFPAYQQVLNGFPRGEFTADVVENPDGSMDANDAFLRDQLLYEKWNVRTHSPYGFSAVEQALDSADLWLKRRGWMRSEYTDGVMPAGFIKTDASYTPEMLRAYNAVFNDYLSGNTRERQRIQALPKGFEPVDQKDTDEKYRPDYDEFLLKLLLSHFGVLPSRLGFTPASGLGGRGHQEGEEDSEERLSTRPTTEWLAALFTRISRQYLAMPAELEFTFLGLDAEDEAAADETDDRRFKGGRQTLNEVRDRIGQPRYDFPEADMPVIITQSGVVFLEGELQKQSDQHTLAQSQAEATTAAANAKASATTAKPAGGASGGESQVSAPKKATPVRGQGDAKKPAQTAAGAKAKADEETALRKFASKGTRGRAFVCEHLTGPEDLTSGLYLPHGGVQVVWKGDAPREELAGVGGARRADVPARPGRGSGFEWARP